MSAVLFRCSSLGRLMTNPTAAAAKAGEILSVGAKTYIRELAAQEIFGVDFIVTSKQMEKGIEVESDSIALLNSVRGLSLVKNAERRTDGNITGECDLWDAPRRTGHDIKSSWSIATFPIVELDCTDSDYDWQMRGYLKLWDADEWHVDYCLVNTPDKLIGYEPQSLHFVDHIPAHQRVTTWRIQRDATKEAAIGEKVRAARDYYAQVIAEFDRSHPQTFAEVASLVTEPAAPRVTTRPAEIPESIFS